MGGVRGGREETQKMEVGRQWVTFCAVLLAYMVWLYGKGSMAEISGDAMENWRSITTWFSAERYGSYPLYKGFAAIYPYVWFYHLATALHLNEFFFCMLYYAALFSYITTIGLPLITEYLTDWTPRLWQRIMTVAFFFVIWKPTVALSELMVDLPSAAYFVMAVVCTMNIAKVCGKKRLLYVLLSGLLTSLCVNISGQYTVSGALLLILAIVQIWKTGKSGKGIKQRMLQIAILFAASAAVKSVNMLFMEKNVVPLVAAGAWIPTGDFWLYRGLLYFLDKNRYLYGITLMNLRGFAILQDICGSEETARTLIEAAGAGSTGWTVPDYLKMVLHYPVDAVVQALDKFFLFFSIDFARQSVVFLVTGYTLFYIAVWNAVRRIRRWRDVVSPKTLIILAALCSALPSMVMTTEPRHGLASQSIVFGTALLCGSIPQTLGNTAYRMSCGQIGQQKKPTFVSVYLVWAVFVLLCMMHMGTLYAQSNMGTEMLFKWW